MRALVEVIIIGLFLLAVISFVVALGMRFGGPKDTPGDSTKNTTNTKGA